MVERTADPTVAIEERGTSEGVPFVRYIAENGERWIIRGACIACGECEVGTVNSNLIWTGLPLGEAGACLDIMFGHPDRLDVPVRPEIASKNPSCTLRGEYL